jgi:hypothetical protein
MSPAGGPLPPLQNMQRIGLPADFDMNYGGMGGLQDPMDDEDVFLDFDDEQDVEGEDYNIVPALAPMETLPVNFAPSPQSVGAIPPANVPPSVPVQLPVDLNAMWQDKCATGKWGNSVFCAMGDGSMTGNMIGSLRLVPGKQGYTNSSMAVTILRLFQMVKKYIDDNRLQGWLARNPGAFWLGRDWYGKFLRSLETLEAMVQTNQPIPISSLDDMSEILYNLMQSRLFKDYIADYLRDSNNLAIFDMESVPAPQTNESWGQWLLRLLGIR